MDEELMVVPEVEQVVEVSGGSRSQVEYRCKWAGCLVQETNFATIDELSQHVDDTHVEPYSSGDLFICQWEGCKVYNRPSFSFGWLQRHVRKHTKEKPNRCLMNGCNMSFNSAEALTKHMNRHFQDTPSPSKKKASRDVSGKVHHKTSVSAARTPFAKPEAVEESFEGGEEVVEGASAKVVQQTQSKVLEVPPPVLQSQKQESFKVRILRKNLFPSSPYAKVPPVVVNGTHVHADVIDRPTMSGIRAMVNCLTRQQVFHSSSVPSLTFTPQVIGERSCDGQLEKELLVRWHPRLLPDEWICISKLPEERVVPFSDLPCSQQSLLYSKCFSFNKVQTRRSKRKP